MEKEIKNLREQFKKRLASLETRPELQKIENEYIGRKGLIAQMLKRMSLLSAAETK